MHTNHIRNGTQWLLKSSFSSNETPCEKTTSQKCRHVPATTIDYLSKEGISRGALSGSGGVTTSAHAKTSFTGAWPIFVLGFFRAGMSHEVYFLGNSFLLQGSAPLQTRSSLEPKAPKPRSKYEPRQLWFPQFDSKPHHGVMPPKNKPMLKSCSKLLFVTV